jgi:type I restriction enzyme S subunit
MLDLTFLHITLQTITFRQDGTSIPQLTVPMVKNYNIPLPPLSEQKRIADIIQTKYDAIKNLNALLKTQLAFTTALSPSFLRQAFRGGV